MALRLLGQLSTYQGNVGLGHGHGHCPTSHSHIGCRQAPPVTSMFLRTLTTMSSKGVKRCAVVGCNNLDKGKVLHALPSLEKDSNLWLEFIFQGHVPEDYSRFLLVCSQHFAPDMFMNFTQVKEGYASKLRLKPGSIPTIRDQASEATSNLEAVRFYLAVFFLIKLF